MTPKPIVIIRYNPDLLNPDVDNLSLKVNEMFDKKLTDYHTFCYPSYEVDAFDFEVFRTDKFSRIQYKRLTDLIKKNMNQLKGNKE